MRIRFLSDQVYEQGAPNTGPRFPAGFVLDEADVAKALGLKETPAAVWTRGFLNRWLQRQVAEEVDDKTVSTTSTEEVGSGRPAKAADLGRMTRAQLEGVAKQRGVDVAKAKSRADVLEALKKAERAAAKK